MELSLLILIFFFPLSVSGLRTVYETLNVNSGAFIYQGYYMFDKKSAPRSGAPGNGESYIEMRFNATKINKDSFGYGDIEAIIASEEYFSSIGYYKDGKQIVCCDSVAVEDGECTMEGKLIIHDSTKYAFPKVDGKFNNHDTDVFVHFDIPKEGKYYIIVGLCDPTTTNLKISGESLVMNPYGHVPAVLYGSIPFNVLLLILYSALFVIWMMRCIRFSNELMSIHYMIFGTLIAFILNTLLTLVNFNLLNSHGYLIHSINFLAVFVSASTRTISRVLMLIVCIGLGVSKATLGSNLWRIVVIGLIYFLVTSWDSLSTNVTSPVTISFYRIIPAAVVDSVIYFWILQSLMDTIQELEEKKQTSKLTVFLKLRSVMVIGAIMCTAYNIIFSYILLEKAMDSYWKYQWFFTDGIWACFYFTMISSVMYLWSPNDHSLAYAYHVQVATEDQENDDDYGIENETLQDDAETIRVSALEGSLLKPMAIGH